MNHLPALSMQTNPIPDPLSDPERDPQADPLAPPVPGHAPHAPNPEAPIEPPEKNPVRHALAPVKAACLTRRNDACRSAANPRA
jgi:hypothetical protein